MNAKNAQTICSQKDKIEFGMFFVFLAKVKN
jgi:hypothetical protein